MGIDVVSFDLDGTLVDTAPQIAAAANRALLEHGANARGVAEITALIGNGGRELMLRLLARVFVEQPAFADTVRVEAVLRDFERQLENVAGGCEPYAGAAEALARLRAAGLKLACVSNKELRHASSILRATHLERLFDVIIGGDSLPYKKPHGSVLRYIVDGLDSEAARAVHVGDSALDVEAAHNAGVAAWAVTYGYNGGRPIAEAKPDRLFAHLGDVAEQALAGDR